MNSAILDEAVRRVVRRIPLIGMTLNLAERGDKLAQQALHTAVLHEYRLLS